VFGKCNTGGSTVSTHNVSVPHPEGLTANPTHASSVFAATHTKVECWTGLRNKIRLYRTMNVIYMPVCI
jgi:anaerobic glycerol-3-phosphate dehydrogenase